MVFRLQATGGVKNAVKQRCDAQLWTMSIHSLQMGFYLTVENYLTFRLQASRGVNIAVKPPLSPRLRATGGVACIMTQMDLLHLVV